MVTPYGDDQPLWQPSRQEQEQANVMEYMHWLAREQGLTFATREELWRWSVEHLEDFWSSVWSYFQIQSSQPYTTVLPERVMPGADWFPGARLNYVEQVLRNATDERPALFFRSERSPLRALAWRDLLGQVGAVAQSLRDMGVVVGDRVVAYMPNIPETVIAFLACASIGAIWSSCSPDFGTSSVIERFQQIEPKVLFSVDGYQYGGKAFKRLPVVRELQEALSSVETTVILPYLEPEVVLEGLRNAVLWSELTRKPAEIRPEQVSFSHPLWILYSSGTTGLPKAIVHGHGGILLEHLQNLSFGMDLKRGERFFWFTTTGWMMWNFLIGGLLLGVVPLLYDGSPGYPHMGVLWEFARESEMNFFGTSAGYIAACMKAGIEPGQSYGLAALRGVGSTGSPLPPEGFRWLYEHVKQDLWLASISGGTDVCSAFVGGSVVLPVYAGELQCCSLGAGVAAFDEAGNSLLEEVGELVITEPLPSMPLFFWNDPDRQRYLESYFAMYPGVWRHGDWIRITERGSAVIYGRSDSTINRMGIRMGSSEIYRVVESLPEVLDSVIVGVELPQGRYYMPLFVVLRSGVSLDEELQGRIKRQLRAEISPHHVPDDILVIQEVPRTLSGKKLEVPIKKLLMGVPLEKAVSKDALSNPQALHYFLGIAERLAQQRVGS